MGGMVGQIVIQALILRGLLLLVARHEADTSFAKVAMVAAGISLGTLVISMFTMQYGPLVTIPAQIAFMAAVLMTFCWISIAKSLIVVTIYAACHFLFTFLMALLLGMIFKGMAPDNQAAMPMPVPGGAPAMSAAYQDGSPQVTMVADANRLKDASDAKRRETEARIKEMEEGASLPPPAPMPKVTVPAAIPPAPVHVSVPAPIPARPPLTPPPELPPDPLPVTLSASNKVSQEKTMQNSSAPEWVAARKALRMGGTMAGSGGYVTMIDGKVYQQGEKVAHTFKGVRYRWRIQAISKDKVDLEPVDATPDR